MHIKVRGHVFELDQIGSDERQVISFVNKEPGMEAPGITMQELCRVGVERTSYCHNCLPHRVNGPIIWHFRQIIALHEGRALEQKAAKGEFLPELLVTGPDGHFELPCCRNDLVLEERGLKPIPPLGTQTCDHRSKPDA
jgi:hypothetical protein